MYGGFFMLRTIIGGVAVGIANVIPGVSGGTMMVILGIFHQVMDSISGIFKKDNPARTKDILFIMQVLIGAAIGLIGFAKILEFLFAEFPTQTMFWFIGLVVFSIPVFLKAEMKEDKIRYSYVILGMALIFLINFMNPGKEELAVNPVFPAVTFFLCIQMIFIGFIGGFSMLLPGVSGSMVLLILGQYYLFKSYLANVTSFQLEVLIPLGFMGIGILIGIVASAKVTGFALKKSRTATLSFILGLIIASSIVLIPLHASYDAMTIITSILSVGLGAIIVLLINKFA